MSQNIIEYNQYITEIIFVGGLGSCLARSIIDTFEFNFFKLPMNIREGVSEVKELSIKTPLLLFKDSDSGLGNEGVSEREADGGSSTVPAPAGPSRPVTPTTEAAQEKFSSPEKSNSESKDPSTISEEMHNSIIASILADEVLNDTKEMNESILAWAKELKKWGDFPYDSSNKLIPGTEELLIKTLQEQSKLLSVHVKTRSDWVYSRAINTLPEAKLKLKEIHLGLNKLEKDYYSKVRKISEIKNQSQQLKEFYIALNEFRNLSTKELNKLDNILIEDIKGSLLYKNLELKKAINVEYVQAKKEFKDNDSYLKNKIGEILKNKK